MSTEALDAVRIIVAVLGLVVVAGIVYHGLKLSGPRKHLHGVAAAWGLQVILFHPSRLGNPDLHPALYLDALGVVLGLLYLWSERRSAVACTSTGRTRHDQDC